MVKWDYSISLGLMVPALIIAGAILVLTIRTLRQPDVPRSWVILEVIRLSIVAAVLVTLCRPERVETIRRTTLPRLVILTDRSGSMETVDIPDAAGAQITRSKWLAAQMEAKFWKPLEANYKVMLKEFDAVDDDDKLKALSGTDLNKALNDAFNDTDDLTALLIISDGDWNLGISPLHAAARMKMASVPIFAIGTGREQYLPDLHLDQVKAPAFALTDEVVSIPFRVQSFIGRDVTTEVALYSGSEKVATKEIMIPANSEMREMILWPSAVKGEHNLTLRVPPEKEEVIHDNNEVSFSIEVRREIIKVMVIDSQPRWEYRFLRNALSRDPGIDLSCMLMHPGMKRGGGPDYIKALPTTRDEISKYDVIFIGDVGVGPKEIPTEVAELIKGLVQHQAAGLVFLPGRRGRIFTINDSPLAPLMPVVLDESRRRGRGYRNPQHLALTTIGSDHLLTMLADQKELNRRLWRRLPGFNWNAGVVRSRPGSHVLAVHSGVRNSWGRVPLLVTRTFGRGSVLFMGTDSAWRWRRGVEDTYHYRFWGQVVRWMAHARHLAHTEGIRLVFSPETPQQGETVHLQVNAYDEHGFPDNRGPVRVEVRAPSGDSELIKLVPHKDGWGLYTGEFVTLESGRYAMTTINEPTDRRLESAIDVSAAVVEPIGRPARHDVLSDIAKLTDGHYGGYRQLADIVGQIQALPVQQEYQRRFRLWSAWWWGLIIVGLCGLYWTVRKLAGLV